MADGSWRLLWSPLSRYQCVYDMDPVRAIATFGVVFLVVLGAYFIIRAWIDEQSNDHKW